MRPIKDKHLENGLLSGPGIHRKEKNCIYKIFERVPARLSLYFLSWSGFLVSFMMRNDINFALVAMVNSNTTTTMTIAMTPFNLINNISYLTTTPMTTAIFNDTATVAQIQSDFNAIGSSTLSDLINNTNRNVSNNSSSFFELATTTFIPNVLSELNVDKKDVGEFRWSSTIKAAILGSFYWCYVMSQVVGGVATQYFGTKNVFGWSQFATAACSLFIPYGASLHYGVLIALRSIQGFASGLTWPAMYAIVGYWIPPAERSRFMSSFQGFSIGIGLTYPLCGFLIEHFGWRYVFYTTGTIGMLWCVMWYFLAFNTPADHPRISKTEFDYIEMNVSEEIKNGKGMKVPWRQIFTSLPVWSIGVTTFGRIWVHYQFIMSGPIYMKQILGFNYQSNGLLSGLPFLCSYISSVFFCYMADVMVTKGLMSLTNVRKLFTASSQIIPGILIFWIGYITDNIILVLIVWFIAVTLITASYAGAMASIVDIAPNLAGPVLAFAQTIHMTASFLSPIFTGFVVKNESSISEWRQVFAVASVIAICTYTMFQFYGTSKIQPWNYPKKPSDESEMLKEDDNNQQKENAST